MAHSSPNPLLVSPQGIIPLPPMSPTTHDVNANLATNDSSINVAEGGSEYNPDPVSQVKSPSPEIPHTISHNGVIFDLLRPDELNCDIPVFGERKRTRSSKTKKNKKRKMKEAAEVEWDRKRRSLPPPIPVYNQFNADPDKIVPVTLNDKLFNKDFVGYTEADMHITEDGLKLPELPAWLNATRERQADGSPGVFLCRPNEEDFQNRFQEMLEALEPIGVEIGATKIAIPVACLDEPVPWSEFQQCKARTSGSPTDTAPKESTPRTTPLSLASTPSSDFSAVSEITETRRARPNRYADMMPSASVDKNGTPRVYSMEQRLPLHPRSQSNLAPIYEVSSTEKQLESGTKWRKAVLSQLERERRITMGDRKVKVYSHLDEDHMVARGRKWSEIISGEVRDGITRYSSDNDATPELRAFLGLGDPHLTELPGNVIHDSKSKVTGIHTPYLYIGRSYTLFALHAEDYNALSLNYQHLGTPKTWRVVCPRDFHMVESFVAGVITSPYGNKGNKKCSQFVRHASVFLPGKTLEAVGARSILFRQNPGELVVTWPLAYHEGWNEGINVNEACGYGHKNWRKVFATGEELEGEETVYRPCDERCGQCAPIILSFDPEGGAVEGSDDQGVAMGEDEDEDEDEDIKPVKMSRRSMSTVSRKRSREIEDEEGVGPVKACRRGMSTNTRRKSLEVEDEVEDKVEFDDEEYLSEPIVRIKSRKRSRDFEDEDYVDKPAKGKKGLSAKCRKKSHDFEDDDYADGPARSRGSTAMQDWEKARQIEEEMEAMSDVLSSPPSRFKVTRTEAGWMVEENVDSIERIIDEYEILMDEYKSNNEETLENENSIGSPTIDNKNSIDIERKAGYGGAIGKERKTSEEKIPLGYINKVEDDDDSVEGVDLVPVQAGVKGGKKRKARGF